MSEPSRMPWVKLYTDFLDDRKIGRLPDDLKLRFLQLILVAGECDAEGYLLDSRGSLSIDDIAWRLRMDTMELEAQINGLTEAGLITCEVLEGQPVFIITNFSKRQGRSQNVKREQWRIAQQKHRDAQMTEEKSSITDECVIHDTVMTHTPREEERREEENLAADAALPANPKPEKPQAKRSFAQHPDRGEVIKYFLIKTGLPAPKTDTAHIKATQKRWWTPVDDLLELVDCDVGRSKELIDLALARLKDVTVTSPQSIIETAKAVLSENHRSPPDLHQQLAEEGYVVRKANEP